MARWGITHRMVRSDVPPVGWRWAFFDEHGEEIPGGYGGACLVLRLAARRVLEAHRDQG